MAPFNPELGYHPASLLLQPPTDGSGRRWLVASTLARQEKSLARDLFHADIPFFLPLVPRRFAYEGRTVLSFVPVFPGLVFLYANPHEQQLCLSMQRTTGLLEAIDQEGLRQELLAIAAALNTSTQDNVGKPVRAGLMHARSVSQNLDRSRKLVGSF